MYSNIYIRKMIGMFINLPDELIKQIKQFMQPTPTAEIMKTHIQRWTKRITFIFGSEITTEKLSVN